jgi:hypothetical protein
MMTLKQNDKEPTKTVELTDTERAFLSSAVKTRYSLRTIATLFGVSHATDGSAFTEQFVLALLEKLK